MNERIRAAFAGVGTEDALKQNAKARVANRMRRIAGIQTAFARRRVAAVACAALMLMCVGASFAYFTPVYAISVDVNPSLELGVNRFERVVSVRGYNDDGLALAQSVQLKNLDYTQAVETLLACEQMRPYIDNGALVSITVAGSTSEKSEEMRLRIAECGNTYGLNVECRCASREEAKAARENGLSMGKYRAYMELRALDASITADDVQGMTMRQLRERIAELSGSSGAEELGNGCGSGNNGVGNGGGRCAGR